MIEHTATLRHFNRTWSQRVGVLDESFLGSGLPVGAGRLLFEIGPSGATVRELRARLDLDSGYLTRLLRRLADAGLAEVGTDATDRRRRVATLTGSGRAAWRRLESRSESLARSLVDPLTEHQRARLTDALRTADLLLRAATVHLRRVPATDPAAVEATAHYFAELDRRFPGGFDAGDARYAGTSSGGSFVVATSEGQPVACGGVQRIDDATAEVKRMWVSPDWRGAGLGSRMLAHLEEEARRLGHTRVVLDTNGTLTEAMAMYARAGYREVSRYNANPYAEHFFAKEL